MSGYDLLAEAAIPGVPLETILCTEKLRSRPCRAPDYEKENRALVALASALVDGVRDSGPGIDPGKLERVFEPFFTTKTSGVGMGLSICRSIINAHGGQMWVSANEPRGAVFQFTLPTDNDS